MGAVLSCSHSQATHFPNQPRLTLWGRWYIAAIACKAVQGCRLASGWNIMRVICSSFPCTDISLKYIHFPFPHLDHTLALKTKIHRFRGRGSLLDFLQMVQETRTSDPGSDRALGYFLPRRDHHSTKDEDIYDLLVDEKAIMEDLAYIICGGYLARHEQPEPKLAVTPRLEGTLYSKPPCGIELG